MTILALDPGLTTGYAFLDCDADGSGLRLSDRAIPPAGILVPAQAGMPGLRVLLRRWLDAVLPTVDEVCAEGEISTVLIRSNIESLKVREILDDHITQFGLSVSYYAPSTVKATIKRLSGSHDKGLPTKAQLRKLTTQLLNITWPIGVDHVSDAIAVGVTHAAKQHDWKPVTYTPPKGRDRVPAGFLDLLHQRYERATGGSTDT